VYVIGFGYPVVAEGHAGVGWQVSGGHNEGHIDGLVGALKKL